MCGELARLIGDRRCEHELPLRSAALTDESAENVAHLLVAGNGARLEPFARAASKVDVDEIGLFLVELLERAPFAQRSRSEGAPPRVTVERGGRAARARRRRRRDLLVEVEATNAANAARPLADGDDRRVHRIAAERELLPHRMPNVRRPVLLGERSQELARHEDLVVAGDRR